MSFSIKKQGEVCVVDVEGQLIVEHWDVVQPYVEADRTVSGNPMSLL